MVRLSRLTVLLAGACAVATVVKAQTAGQPPSISPSAQVSEVVVTAQRRTERLQDVPLAVSVVSNQSLDKANYSGLTDLQLLVPSLQYNSYLGGGFQVRGVGTQTINLSTEQDVAIMVDDVVQGLPELTFATPSYQALTDIDRVEVLKGPQGTLFGKNSSVGVVQVITKRPQLGVYSADITASAATHGEYKVQGNINVPLGDTLAGRLSAFEYHHDGYINNLYTGKDIGGYDQYGVRGKLLWKPTDKLTIYLIGDGMHTSDTGNGAWTLRNCGSGFFTFNACATDAPYGVRAGPNNRSVALDAPTPANTNSQGGSLHIDYELGRDTLTVVSAVEHMTSHENVDVDNSPLRILDMDTTDVDGTQYTQEVRLSSPSNQFIEYTVGAYYYNVHSQLKNVLAGTFGFEPLDSTILLSNGFAGLVSGGQTVLNSSTESYAVFGQTTLHVTHRLQLIGGLRFTHDDVSAGVHVNPYPNVCEFNYAFGAPCHTVSLPSPEVTQPTSASNVSGKGTIKYDFTDRVNVYATFATGYKGPAISYGALLPLSAVQPETSTAYELGLKSELFDRHLVFNADIFYQKYKNFQADTFVLNADNPAASNFELANAGGLESKGFEADANWMPTRDLTLTGGLTIAPTRFTDFVIQCQNQFTNPATVGPCFQEGGISLFNAHDYPLPQAPKYSFTLSGDYQHEVFSGYLADLNINYVWRSSTYSLPADVNTIQGAYGLLNFNVGFGPQDGRWRVSVFARNVLDQKFVAAIFPTFLDNGAATGIALPTIGYSNIPSLDSLRTIGIKLNVKFGG